LCHSGDGDNSHHDNQERATGEEGEYSFHGMNLSVRTDMMMTKSRAYVMYWWP
jgi:hypothetical protein